MIVEALKNCGVSFDEEYVSKIIVDSAQSIKAEARQASRKCAELVNRHLESKKIKDKELEIEVDRWFDKLDSSKLETIQKVFPGKELLPKVIEALNKEKGVSITRGNLVAIVNETLIAKDIIEFLKSCSTLQKAIESKGVVKKTIIRRRYPK